MFNSRVIRFFLVISLFFSSFLYIPPSDAADFDELIDLFSGFKTGSGGDFNNDGNTNHLDVFQFALEWRRSIFFTALERTDPVKGEGDVALTRETILQFDAPLDPSTVTDTSVYAVFGGDFLPATRRLSSDGKRVTLFYDEPLPHSSRVRVFVNGNELRDATGESVDGDNDGRRGGIGSIDFDTLSLSTIPGTSVYGRVFASELATAKGSTQTVNIPLEGVVITVDGAETTYRAETDNMGNFIMDPAPAGKFFVHVDGRQVESALIGGVTTTTSFPQGPYYPFVGKPWTAAAGEATDVGDVHLPLVLEGSLQQVSETEDTSIGFPAQVLSAHPEFASVNLTVPANSLFSDNGTPGGMVGIAPVPPDRLPGDLPDGLEFPVVITVQTSGPTNFDIPAPVCMPNLPDPVTGETAPPGSQQFLFSFNHDSGVWDPIGSMTVDETGELVCTDEGVGIRAPGWHGVAPRPYRPRPTPFPTPSPSPTCDSAGSTTQAECNERCESNEPRCASELEAAGHDRIRTCADTFGARSALTPLCMWAYTLMFPYIDQACEMEKERCMENCEECASKSIEAFGKGAPEDPLLGEILDILEVISELTYPYVISGDEMPQSLIDQINQLLDDADALAGGDAVAFLEGVGIAAEDDIADINAQIGQDPGNAPEYPIYFMAEIARPNGPFRVRRQTGPYGDVWIVVPQDGTLHFVWYYDPVTDSFGISTTNLRPGDEFTITRPYLSPFDESAIDTDGDDLVDLAELVIGTKIDNPDSDGDGVSDKAEVEQGSDPLGGLPVRQGVIGTVGLQGSAVDICSENDVLAVAQGFDGVAILNVFNRMNPKVVSQFETPGIAQTVACSGNLVAVADGNAGCTIVDISDPPEARIIHQIDLGGFTKSVATNGNLAYAALRSGRIFTIDMPSGIILDQTPLTLPVEDMSFAGNLLAVLQSGRITILRSQNGFLEEVGRAVPASGLSDSTGSRIFNGFPIVYYTHFSGVYGTLDISDPANPVPLGAFAPYGTGHGVAANGSGIVLTSYSRAFPSVIGAFGDLDHSVVDNLLFETGVPGNPVDVSIFNGLGYVAASTGGVHVLNYLPYDAQGLPPVIELTADFLAESKGPVPQVEEGKSALLIVNGTDDVQIRDVEFYLDGERVLKDGGFPFEYRFTTPSLDDQTEFTIQAKATDTGGNFTMTDPITVQLTADMTAPSVLYTSPRNGESIGSGLSIAAFFNEPLDATSVGPNALRLTDLSSKQIIGIDADVSYREDLSAIFFTSSDPLPPGLYRAEVGPPIADLAGNTMASSYSWTFDAPALTTIEGLVEYEGVPVEGAHVMLVGMVKSATTGPDGSFSIPGVQIDYDSTIALAVNATIGEDTVFGGIAGVDPVHRGVTDVGTIALGVLCDPQLVSDEFPLPGIDGAVRAMTVFDDGTGAALYIGGEFTIAGNNLIQNIAKWDGESFSPVGQVPGSVQSLAVYNDGTGESLYAGTQNIFQWTGTAWETVGTGIGGAFNNLVLSLAVYDNELYVGGLFNNAGGTPANGIAKWNGTAWSAVGDPLGNGLFTPNINAMVEFQSELYVGGNFTMVGDTETNGIARWNGSAWSAVIEGVSHTNFAGVVDAFAVSDDGLDLYVGGDFETASGVVANNIAMWNGTEWSTLGAGINGNRVDALSVYDDGTGSALYAGGDFTQAGLNQARHVAKWDGNAWSQPSFGVVAPVGGFGGVSPIESLAVFDDGAGDRLIAGGSYAGIGTSAARSISTWDGEGWESLTDGLNEAVDSMAVYDDGTGPALYAGGSFTHDGDRFLSSIAKREGNRWTPLSGGLRRGVNAGGVTDMEVFDAGGGPELYVCGSFSTAGTATVNNIAKWDGEFWSSVGGGPFGIFYDLTVFDDGTGEALYAVGGFTTAGTATASNVAKWDGEYWSPLGEGLNATAQTIDIFDDGSGPALFVGGGFTMSGTTEVNRIAKWNGAFWEPLSVGVNSSVQDLVVFDDGSGEDLYVIGQFNSAGGLPAPGIAKWDGFDWSPVGTGTQASAGPSIVFDDGTGPALYVANALGTQDIGKWDGVEWTPLDIDFVTGSLRALIEFDDGSGPALFIGGNFLKNSDTVSAYMAKYSRPFPPCE